MINPTSEDELKCHEEGPADAIGMPFARGDQKLMGLGVA